MNGNSNRFGVFSPKNLIVYYTHKQIDRNKEYILTVEQYKEAGKTTTN